jgi:hypothetical protein
MTWKNLSRSFYVSTDSQIPRATNEVEYTVFDSPTGLQFAL